MDATMQGSMATAAKVPLNEMQERIRAAYEEYDEIGRQDGGPDDTPEVKREAMMLSGAVQGVQQRVAELAAALRPILGLQVTNQLVAPTGPKPSTPENWKLDTQVGVDLRSIQNRISEIEDTLGILLSGVRSAL